MGDEHYNEEDGVCECEHDYSHVPEHEEDYESRYGDDVRYWPGGPVDMDSATQQNITDALVRFFNWLFNDSTS